MALQTRYRKGDVVAIETENYGKDVLILPCRRSQEVEKLIEATK